jgi:hypothetical protein
MKKGLILLFIISTTFCPYIANATYHLTGFAVQNRVYENGDHLTRLYFECKDGNNLYPEVDVLGSIGLMGPNGLIENVTPTFSSYQEVDGSYNAGNGMWSYPAPAYTYSGYSANLQGALIPGPYNLMFTDKDGEVSALPCQVVNIVDLPIIQSGSYRHHFDKDGNFICQWQVPDNIPQIYPTSARVWISQYDKQNKLIAELFVTIPTHVGFLFVPKVIVDQVRSTAVEGATFKLGTRINTLDGLNRAISTEAPISINPGQTSLASNFAGLGLYSYDSNTSQWKKISSLNSENTVTSGGSTLYADFGTSWGLWKWDGASWSKISALNPEKMVISGSTLYAGFGASWGLWKWDGATWSRISTLNPEKMVISDSTLYADFGASWGIWKLNGSSWSKIAATAPMNMTAPN